MTSSDPETERIQSIDSLAQRQDKVEGKLDQVLAAIEKFTGGPPATHQQAERQAEERLDRPSSVAEQVRAELAKAVQDRASRQAADDDKSEREQMRERLAKLEEKQPEPPQPRRQRVMFGPRT